ncbi:endonuclease/exonuclease/phosphatase family protein [Microlunatus antarcticus]|uniref:Metal-dependent hydrolase, endonuclease/exonuclease/phosphatase family n=1 Tax=Microlunatus antarcticus TaxID=53388 RepID=A0A7W5JXD0_9ACTN|nr:endonuclease/exonuclease/phosphatase family protein [Microlunatus antarcticus]MBB3327467.1 hypothetical protein [Microlunatus antarcticus]
MAHPRVPTPRLPAVLALVGALLFTLLPAAPASAATTYATTYAELNCNWQGYTAGESVDGVDLTWAKGSGSSRRYIRAQRLADLLRGQVKASLYALTECDTQMLDDLVHLMGSQWEHIGGDNTSQNRTGWLYDSGKWSPGKLSTTTLPGDPDGGYTGRRLLQVGFSRKVTGTDPMLSVAMTHLSSGNPEARDLQMRAALAKMDGKVRLLAGDLNASTPPGETPCDEPGPRSQLACAGWDEYGSDVPSWHDYGRNLPGLALDVVAVSPAAQAAGRITLTSRRTVDTAPTYASDHRVLVVGVAFS